MLSRAVMTFVRAALPPAPARVLEVGAGTGELAGALTDAGYEVVAIDPAAQSPAVRAVSLHEVDEPYASFDAAVAVVSLHHVEPLGESCRRLGELVRPGGALVVDELDLERFDERAAQWVIDQRGPREGSSEAQEMLAGLREHLHPLGSIHDALEEWFLLPEPVRGPYLYRWELPPGLRDVEEQLIADGRLPAIGARMAGTRRDGVTRSPRLRDGELELRPFEPSDAEALEALLAEPEVTRWWQDGDYERDTGWVVAVHGDLAGWVQYEEERYDWYPSVALDIALTTALHGRGYGRRVLRLAIEHFAAKGHHRFTIDPRVDNERAIRSYAAAGFKPVGVLRAYERNPDGGWNDGLLMDLIVIDGMWSWAPGSRAAPGLEGA